jgi:hypothetical protein
LTANYNFPLEDQLYLHTPQFMEEIRNQSLDNQQTIWDLPSHWIAGTSGFVLLEVSFPNAMEDQQVAGKFGEGRSHCEGEKYTRR